MRCTAPAPSSRRFPSAHPARPDQHSAPLQLRLVGFDRDGAVGADCPIQHDPGQPGHVLERNPGQVAAVAMAVERAVEVGRGVANQLHLRDVELRLLLIERAGLRVIAERRYSWSLEARKHIHAVGDLVTQLDVSHGPG